MFVTAAFNRLPISFKRPLVQTLNSTSTTSACCLLKSSLHQQKQVVRLLTTGKDLQCLRVLGGRKATIPPCVESLQNSIINTNRSTSSTLSIERLFSSNVSQKQDGANTGSNDSTPVAVSKKTILDAMFNPVIITTPDGKQYATVTMTKNPKLKPFIIKRRLAKLKTYEGKELNIRHSAWRLNLICQYVSGLTVEDAVQQLDFSKKVKAPLIQKIIRRTANLADIRHGIQYSQLEIAECFSTRGSPLKRLKIMGRGRTGLKERQHSHVRIVLREIDFKLKIYLAKNITEKKRWISLRQRAENEHNKALSEREELATLEKKVAEQAKKSGAKK